MNVKVLKCCLRIYHFCEPVFVQLLPSVLWHCWLGGRKGIQPVKKLSGGWVGCWHGHLSGSRCRLAYGSAMPLSLTVSCFSKIQIGFTFTVPAHLGSPGKRAVKRVRERVFVQLVFAFSSQLLSSSECCYIFLDGDVVILACTTCHRAQTGRHSWTSSVKWKIVECSCVLRPSESTFVSMPRVCHRMCQKVSLLLFS